ncbi:MAG: H+-transporting two-sector ATPase, subunit [Acidobacteriales bacterium]|nr:H+-transporting two-sector ATPase, subunit [Terriglobales bacterium]
MKTFYRLALLLICLCFSAFAIAQSTPAAEAAHQQPSSEAPAAQGGHHEADAPAAAGEKENDEEAQFKESKSVKWLGEKLGLNPTQAYWASWILNFLIIAGLIVFALKANLPGMFRERTAAIQKGIEEARRASAEANTRLSDIQSRLARLDTEITEMRSKAEQDSAAEDERLRAATEEEKRKIIQNAEQEIAAAANAARRELKQLAAELAVSLAEKKISVSDGADKALVREFSTHLSDGNSATKGGR